MEGRGLRPRRDVDYTAKDVNTGTPGWLKLSAHGGDSPAVARAKQDAGAGKENSRPAAERKGKSLPEAPDVRPDPKPAGKKRASAPAHSGAAAEPGQPEAEEQRAGGKQGAGARLKKQAQQATRGHNADLEVLPSAPAAAEQPPGRASEPGAGAPAAKPGARPRKSAPARAAAKREAAQADAEPAAGAAKKARVSQPEGEEAGAPEQAPKPVPGLPGVTHGGGAAAPRPAAKPRRRAAGSAAAAFSDSSGDAAASAGRAGVAEAAAPPAPASGAGSAGQAKGAGAIAAQPHAAATVAAPPAPPAQAAACGGLPGPAEGPAASALAHAPATLGQALLVPLPLARASPGAEASAAVALRQLQACRLAFHPRGAACLAVCLSSRNSVFVSMLCASTPLVSNANIRATQALKWQLAAPPAGGVCAAARQVPGHQGAAHLRGGGHAGRADQAGAGPLKAAFAEAERSRVARLRTRVRQRLLWVLGLVKVRLLVIVPLQRCSALLTANVWPGARAHCGGLPAGRALEGGGAAAGRDRTGAQPCCNSGACAESLFSTSGCGTRDLVCSPGWAHVCRQTSLQPHSPA
jgi:hypothetical protein